jgi:aminopeptidase N
MRTAALPLAILAAGLATAAGGAPSDAAPSNAAPGAESAGDPFAPGLGDAGYVVQHSTLDLNVDVAHDRLDGRATLSARATQALSRLSLDLTGLQVSRATVDGTAARVERAGAKLRITPSAPLPQGATFQVEVDYHGRPATLTTASSDGGWHDDGREVYVMSEPDGAQTWFPSNDSPRDKASYTFRLTVPAGYEAVANGTPIRSTSDSTTTTSTWIERRPMASYLATIAVARLTVQRSRGPHDLPILVYAPPARAARTTSVFGQLPRMIGYFERLIGAYPFDSSGAIVLDRVTPFDLETQTRPVYGQQVLSYPQARAQEAISHELAHQWFGDSVTPSTWRDIWLNEGFATYLSWLWLEHEGARAYLTHAITSQYAFILAAVPYDRLLTHPDLAGAEAMSLLQRILRIQGTPMSRARIMRLAGLSSVEELTARRALGFLGSLRPGSADARDLHRLAASSAPASPPRDDLFTQSVYVRGALALQALRLRLGTPTFLRVLHRYYLAHRDGNATTADFIRAAETVSHRDLRAVFQLWLDRPAPPPMPRLLPTQ